MGGPWAFDPSSVNYKMLSEDTVFISGLEIGDTGAQGVPEGPPEHAGQCDTGKK
jgi:hypothetical protein